MTFDIRTHDILNAKVKNEHIEGALRTYATWLVRAAQREMAASGPENTPKKEVELT